MILPDPFGVDKSQRVNDVTSAWPPLAFADIFQYFVVSRHYSLDESKNWKTLDGYIITLLTVMSNKFCSICHMSMILLADVLPSQRQLGVKNSMYTAYLVVNQKMGYSDSAQYMHGRIYKIFVLLRVLAKLQPYGTVEI